MSMAIMRMCYNTVVFCEVIIIKAIAIGYAHYNFQHLMCAIITCYKALVHEVMWLNMLSSELLL